MNIVLVTNTYTPHVGGVARSVEAFRREYLALHHKVIVIAPEFEGMPTHEENVLRVRAIQNFNASDFSVVLPVPKGLTQTLEEFGPDIIHSQHPFLLGMTAIRIARMMKLSLVFTHHTLYEQYTHYVPGDSALLKKFVVELATGYANLADQVIAPSESIRDLIIERGVKTPIEVIPTGVNVQNFSNGDGKTCRASHDIPDESWVIGHMGRLALEKNIRFLTGAVELFMKRHRNSYFLVVGEGDKGEFIENQFARAGLGKRLVLTGKLEGKNLANAMNAMNVFAFTSKTETQGMVLTEAMAAGLPVVALDAAGAREVVRDGINGRLLKDASEKDFSSALAWVYDRNASERDELIEGARKTAREFSMVRSAEKALTCFARVQRRCRPEAQDEEKAWEFLLGRIKNEWEIIRNLASAGDKALGLHESERSQGD
ncbi:MAG: glycosyltransferase [Gammaproteobacteria bacterium]